MSRDNAVTTFDYRLVTIAWTGLSPDNSNAFTGALGTAVAGGPPHRSVPERVLSVKGSLVDFWVYTLRNLSSEAFLGLYR